MGNARRTRGRGTALRAFASALAALALAGAASADTQPGSLSADAGAADLYQVTCSDDGRGAPASLAVAVLDAAPVAAPLVSVQIQKGNAASNATDAVDGDAGFSPVVFIDGGAGVYDVFVDKTAAGAENFVLSFQCTTGAGGGGDPTGTSIFPSTAPEVPLLPFAGWLMLATLITLCAAPLRGAAHTVNETLGASAAATDLIQIVCSDDGSGAPTSLSLQVRDNAPVEGAFVSVQVQRGALLSNGTDPIDGDASFSPSVHVNGGAGAYDVLVDKSGAGAESYTLTFHCTTGPDGTGVHTGTSDVIVQDQ